MDTHNFKVNKNINIKSYLTFPSNPGLRITLVLDKPSSGYIFYFIRRTFTS